MLAACPVRAEPRDIPAFNEAVLQLIESYPDGGKGGYVWPAPRGTHGTTRDLRLGKARIARTGRGTHCVGLTFEVFWRALELFPGGPAGAGLSARSAARLRHHWFVPIDGGPGPAEALPAFKLGVRVASLEDARPGDFVQVWFREGWGHSMVFLGWRRDAHGQIIALRYWSSQPWTNGIGASEFIVGPGEGELDPSRIFIGRAQPPGRNKRTHR